MNIREYNNEIRKAVITIVENVLRGRTGLAELKLFSLRILNNAQLILDDDTRKLLNDIADAAFEHDYGKLRRLIR